MASDLCGTETHSGDPLHSKALENCSIRGLHLKAALKGTLPPEKQAIIEVHRVVKRLLQGAVL